jgi:very-short-patch-repair endonuclease
MLNIRMKTPQTFARELPKNQTHAEALLWSKLRNRQLAGVKFRRQVPIAGYVADFAALSEHVVVELDGGQHSERTEYDAGRSKVFESAGFIVLRFWNSDVLSDVDSVLATIHSVLRPDEYSVVLSPEGRGRGPIA